MADQAPQNWDEALRQARPTASTPDQVVASPAEQGGGSPSSWDEALRQARPTGQAAPGPVRKTYVGDVSLELPPEAPAAPAQTRPRIVLPGSTGLMPQERTPQDESRATWNDAADLIQQHVDTQILGKTPPAAAPPVRRNPRTGLPMTETPPGTGPLGILDAPLLGAQQIAEGAQQFAQPNPDKSDPATWRRNPRTGLLMRGDPVGPQQAAGAAKVIGGAMRAATPLLPAAAVAAPLGTVLTVGSAMLADKGVSTGLKAAGVEDGYADLAGVVAAALVGGGGAKALLDKARVAAGNPEFKLGEKFPEPKPLAEMSDPELVAHANRIETEQPKNYDWQKNQIAQEVMKRRAGRGMPTGETAAATPPSAEVPISPADDLVENELESHIRTQEQAEIAKRAKPVSGEPVASEPAPTSWDESLARSRPVSTVPPPSAGLALVEPGGDGVPLPTAAPVIPTSDEKPSAPAAEQVPEIPEQQGPEVAHGLTVAESERATAADGIAETYGDSGLKLKAVEATPEEIRAAAERIIDEKPHLAPHLAPAVESSSSAGTASGEEEQSPPVGGSGDLRATGETGGAAPASHAAGSGVDGGGVATAEPAGTAGDVAVSGGSPGEPASYEAGKYYDIAPSQFHLDPVRFQFKQEGVGQKGVTDQFKEVKKWNPNLAGTVHAWRDPANGKVYPVNGHHRVELGQRIGDDGVPEGIHTRMIDARNAQEARSKGALINIGEGNGTALDVAKYMRDSGQTRAQIEAEGDIVFNKRSSQQGAALANLSQPIFDDVVAGSLPVERAAIIGEGLPNKADQKILYDVIKKAEARGSRPTNDRISEMIRLANGGAKAVKPVDDQGGLFGDTDEVEQSLLGEKAEISDYVRRQQLKAEKKLFGAVGNEGAAERLGATGNVIKAGENKQVAERANQALEVYDKLSASAGPVDRALERAALELVKPGADANAVKQRAFEDIRTHVQAQADQLAGVRPGGHGGSAEVRPGGLGDTVSGQLDQPGEVAPVAEAKPQTQAQRRAAGLAKIRERVATYPDEKLRTLAEHGKPTVRQMAAEILEERAKPASAQASIVSPAEEQRSQADAKSAADKLLGDQLSAQLKSGGQVHDPHLQPAENRGLFEEPSPESGGLFDNTPPEPSKADDGVYFGSGLGALEPLFREAKAEGDALRAKRNAALDAAKAALETPEERKAGEKLRAYFTAERDLWAARANQALDIVSRKVLPRIQDREAVAVMREFRHRPGELQQFIDGTHPCLEEADGGPSNAVTRLEKLQPVMRQAMRMLLNPTKPETAADRLYTNIAAKSLAEGKAGGWLGSRWQSDEYVPHLVNPKGEGEVAKAPSTAGRVQGKIGKYFSFGERRQDQYPTMLHAVADGLIPKTLDPSAAFTVHADKFAQARATHLLEGQLAESGLGKWGSGSQMPEGWEPMAPHSDEFRKLVPFLREGAAPGIEPGKTYKPNEVLQSLVGDQLQVVPDVAEQRLWVPSFIAKAMGAITDPDYTAKIPVFAKLRTAQRGLKQAILGLSGFHLLTENAMAMADVGPLAMARALKAGRETLPFLLDERDLIGSGGTTSIQGSTMDAYRNLRPGTIPTRGEVIRAYIPGSKQALEVADSITRLTFDNVQRKFKVVSFALHRDAWMKDNPTATADQLAEEKKGIASYVNGVYGGLHWENIGIGRAMVEISRAFFLAPDWSGSNVALAKYAKDSPVSPREFGLGLFEPLRGATTKESAQARLSRAFWVKQLVGGLLATQMLSLMFSGKLSPRPFQVYQGRDNEGRDVYQNVVFRGSAGDLVSLGTKMEQHGLLVGAGVFLGSKAAPFTKAGIHLITGRDDLGREIAPQKLGVVANTARSVGSLIGDLSPVPIVARGVQRTMLGKDADKFLWSERMLGLFGPQAQHVLPDGMGKNGHQSADPVKQMRREQKRLLK